MIVDSPVGLDLAIYVTIIKDQAEPSEDPIKGAVLIGGLVDVHQLFFLGNFQYWTCQVVLCFSLCCTSFFLLYVGPLQAPIGCLDCELCVFVGWVSPNAGIVRTQLLANSA